MKMRAHGHITPITRANNSRARTAKADQTNKQETKDWLHAYLLTQSRLIATLSSLIARRRFGPQTHWRPHHKALISDMGPGAMSWACTAVFQLLVFWKCLQDKPRTPFFVWAIYCCCCCCFFVVFFFFLFCFFLFLFLCVWFHYDA